MKPEPHSTEAGLVITRQYNKKELCVLLGVTKYYLNYMISELPDIGLPLGTCYSPKQVLMLLNHYGFAAVFMQNVNKMRK